MPIGQSNVSAFAGVGPVDYTPTWRVQIWTDVNGNGRWDYGDNFQAMVPGVNTGTWNRPDGWGVEVPIAQAWLDAGAPGGILYIGKAARGETTIVQNGGLDWSPHSVGELFDEAAFVAACMRANLGVTSLDAVFMMEGETAATRADWSAAYEDALFDFTAAVRDRLMNDPAGYIGLGRIGEAATMPYAHDVRVAQWALDQVDPNLESFRTIDFDHMADGVHLSAEGVWQAGAAFTANWLAS